MQALVMPAKWILVLGGLLMAYEGMTGSDLVAQLLGGMAMIVNVVVFGGAAVVLGYHMLTIKGKR